MERRALLWVALLRLLPPAAHLCHRVDIENSFIDGMSIMSYQPLDGVGTGEYMGAHVLDASRAEALQFVPPKLSLGTLPLGIPHVQRITIVNKLNRTVHLTSISGNTVHFHSSFFESKIIPPNGNTSFNVVFLGRAEGIVDTSLFIHTSEGIHKYVMSATSTPCAYRLPPLLRLKLPYNATYSPLIYMHNPHDYPIQITEVYSSGGNVILELPGGELEGPQALWLLPPRTTRAIIGVRYNPLPLSLHLSQHPLYDKEYPTPQLSYIRIKFHGTPVMLSSILVVAVEIFALAETGPYTVPQFIDFGLGGTKDAPKKVRLLMGNTSPRPIRISSVNVDIESGMPWGGLRVLTTAKTLLPPFSPPDIHIATLSLNWKQVYDSGQCCGKLIVKTRQDHKIEVPFISQTLNGGLIMNDESVTRYLTSDSGITAVRQVLLKNTFNVGIFVSNLIIGKGMEKYFEISAFYPQDFKINTIQHGFRIQLKSWTKSLKFESKITLITNISSQVIPVYIYNGKLDMVMSIPPRPSNKGTLDLGLVTVSSATHANILLCNANPVPVCLRGCGSDFPGAAIQLLGCLPQPSNTFDLGSEPLTNVTTCTCIPAKWCAAHFVSVVAPANPVTTNGELWISSAYEKIVVPILLSAVNEGQLSQPKPLKFENCFPGTVCSLSLQLQSTFLIDMDVISVDPVPVDQRLYYSKKNQLDKERTFDDKLSVIAATSLSNIGWLHYDPYLYCNGKCYAGLDLNTTVGQRWLSQITLPKSVLDVDIELINSYYYIYTNLSTLYPYTNISIRIDTTQVRNFIIPVHIPFIWPKLYAGPSTITLPLSQIGRPSYIHFSVFNPSLTRPVLVQLAFEWMLDDSGRIQNLPNRFKPPNCPNEEWCANALNNTFYFPRITLRENCLQFRNNSEYCDENSKSECFERKNIWTNYTYWWPFDLHPHPDSCVFFLSPNEQKNITLAFLTQSPKKVSSVLFIRNNLTVIETLRLTGEGVVASLKFANRKPGSTVPLLFDITEKHLKDCDKDKNKKTLSSPNFTVKRTLVARNTGVIPIQIKKFFINSIECEGYGFRVLNCESFELPPNGTHKVDIAFTPDFTLTKVQRLLILETSLSDFVNFTLKSSIPVSLAAKCAAVLRRPHWESSLLVTTVSILICIGVCVVFAGCYESYKILTEMSVTLLRESSNIQPFDLRTIGQTSFSKKTDNWNCCSAPLENPDVKLLNWNFTYNSQNGDTKSTHTNKYDESNAARKRKLCKKSVNSLDSTLNESILDKDVQNRERKFMKDNNNSSWKNVFSRSTLGLKTQKNVSQNDCCETNDIQKLLSNSSSSQEQISDKHSKLSDAPKKLSTIFDEGNSESNNEEILYTNSNKKHSKLKCISLSSHSCEEDTSSTTTESSNNDDADKDNDISTSSSNKSISSNCKKSILSNHSNKKGKSISQCRDNEYKYDEDEDYDHKSQSSQSSSQNDINQKWYKNKEPSVSHTKSNLDNKQTIENNKNNVLSVHDNVSNSKQTKKDNSKINQKKEKQTLSKKRSLDKSFIFTGKVDNNHLTGTFNTTRNSIVTPPVTTTVWEKRASFSDVVSRSDSSYSHNFANRNKELHESKKTDSKILHSRSDTNVQTHNTNKFIPDESRKSECNNVSSQSELGPIGSNCYSKKSFPWADSNTENQTRYRISNNIQPMKNTQAQKISDATNLNANSNNSLNSSNYFLKSSPYLSDLSSIKSSMSTSSHNGSGTSNSFGSIGSQLNAMSNISNNMPRMQYAVSSSSLQGLNPRPYENNLLLNTSPVTLRDISSYDTNIQNTNYIMNTSPSLSTNLNEIPSNTGLLDLAKSNMPILNADNMHMPMLDSFDNKDNTWNKLPSDNVNINNISSMGGNMSADKMFDMEYNARMLYDDNQMIWNDSNDLWNTPPRTTLNMPIQNIQSSIDVQSPSSNLTSNMTSSSDCGAAEWLWGYNTNKNMNVMETMPTQTQTDSLSTQSSHKQNQSQYQQYNTNTQQETQHPYDQYHPLNSIWSTGSSVDPWMDQQNYMRSNQDLNNQNHY